MRLANSRNWYGESVAKLLTSEATPPASVSKLALADSYAVDAAVMPYAGCGRVFDATETSGGTVRIQRYLGIIVAPAAVHARGAIARSYTFFNAGSLMVPSQSWTNTGGTAGANIVTTQDNGAIVGPVVKVYTFGFGLSSVAEIAPTGITINDAPAATMDRQYELTTDNLPYIEPMFITHCGGFSVQVSERLGDLETL